VRARGALNRRNRADGAAWAKYKGTEWEPLLHVDSVAYRADPHEAEAMVGPEPEIYRVDP
jgi:hypothetical protein